MIEEGFTFHCTVFLVVCCCFRVVIDFSRRRVVVHTACIVVEYQLLIMRDHVLLNRNVNKM